MDIFEHIMKEHREVEGMLQQLSGGGSGKQETFNKMKLALTAHIKAEEGSIYPAMHDSDGAFIDQATEEHAQVMKLLNSMDSKGVGDDSFADNIASLTSMIQSHVMKEEEQMIPKARDMYDQDQVKKLSQKFDQIDESIMQKAR